MKVFKSPARPIDIHRMESAVRLTIITQQLRIHLGTTDAFYPDLDALSLMRDVGHAHVLYGYAGNRSNAVSFRFLGRIK